MKTILVPTDFSVNANNALDYAIGIAKLSNTEIILIHAYYDIFVSGEIPAQFILEKMANTKKEAENNLSKLNERVTLEKIKCRTITFEDIPVEMIIEESKKLNPDLIIMGTKGASGLLDTILGSITSKVIEKVKCPVLAIPGDAVFRPIQNILFMTDYKESDVMAVKFITEFGLLFDACLTIVHVCEDEDSIAEVEEEKMENFRNKITKATKYEKMIFKINFENDFLRSLDSYKTNLSPELIAMSTHPRGVLEKLFRSSTTRKVVLETQIPLMTFRQSEASIPS
jgi:nucleotide-binding universal stress UspA family protein